MCVCVYISINLSQFYQVISYYSHMSFQSLDFRFSLRHLRYNQNNTISIRSGNDDFPKVSSATMFTFVTPSCLQIHHNLSVCGKSLYIYIYIYIMKKRIMKKLILYFIEYILKTFVVKTKLI